MSSSLRDLVRYLRENGASDASIKSTLLSLGYSKEEIERAMAKGEGSETEEVSVIAEDLSEKVCLLEGRINELRRELDAMAKKLEIAMHQPSLTLRLDRLEARLEAVIQVLKDYAPQIFRRLDDSSSH